MRKPMMLLVVLGAAGALVGCVGDTQEATEVHATEATLNAYGHTNNGPAYWWWEWGESRKAVTNGQGTKTTKLGPASSANNVTVSQKITGLDRSQAYYFRACGQDQAAGSAVQCGTVRHFDTPQGDSTIAVVGDHTRYVGDPAATHWLQITRDTSVSTGVKFREADSSATKPPAGSDFLPGAGCFALNADVHQTYQGLAFCSVTTYIEAVLAGGDDQLDAVDSIEPVNATMGAGNDFFVGDNDYGLVVSLGSGNDQFSSFSSGAETNAQVYGDDGNDKFFSASGDDILHGGSGNDSIHGGYGVDSIYGEDGDDVLYGGPGVDGYDCGPGDDTVHVSSVEEYTEHATGCEHYVVDDTS